MKYSLPDVRVGGDFIIFGAGMSLLLHIDDKGKGILTLGKGITQGLNHT